MGRLSSEIKEELIEEEEKELAEAETKEEEETPKEEEKKEEEEEIEEKEGEETEEKPKEEKPSEEKAEETKEEKPEESKPSITYKIIENGEEKEIDPHEIVAQLKHKVKPEGEELEVDYEELVKGYQLAKTAHKRIQEGNQKTKDAEAIYRLLEKDPLSALEQIFTHLEKGDYSKGEARLYEKVIEWIEPRIARASMSEEERNAYDEKRMLEREKKQLAAEKEKIKKEREDKVAREAQAKFEEELQEALDKYKIPKDDKTLRRLAYYIKDEYLDLDVEASAEQMVYSFKKERERREAEWKEQKTPPKGEKKKPEEPPPEEKKRQKSSTPQFPSTPSGEGESPTRREERAKEPKYYSNVREFHEAMREQAGK